MNHLCLLMDHFDGRSLPAVYWLSMCRRGYSVHWDPGCHARHTSPASLWHRVAEYFNTDPLSLALLLIPQPLSLSLSLSLSLCGLMMLREFAQSGSVSLLPDVGRVRSPAPEMAQKLSVTTRRRRSVCVWTKSVFRTTFLSIVLASRFCSFFSLNFTTQIASRFNRDTYVVTDNGNTIKLNYNVDLTKLCPLSAINKQLSDYGVTKH